MTEKRAAKILAWLVCKNALSHPHWEVRRKGQGYFSRKYY